MESQMPSTPMIAGKNITAAHSNTSVRKNDMSAETRPLLSAVKNAEPKMLTPTKMNASEYSPRAETVISHRAGSYPTNTAASGCAKRCVSTVISAPPATITPRQVRNKPLSSAEFFAP